MGAPRAEALRLQGRRGHQHRHARRPEDSFLDHDHSSYVDQWDWEKVITAEDRNLDYLKNTVQKIWKVLRSAGERAREMYPDLPRKQRETAILQEHPAIFIIGIGWVLADGYPHEMRAADYDDWVTETVSESGKPCHGLNGDILVWNPVTRRRHELTSMGIRVTKETLVQQMHLAGLEKDLELPYHQAILNDEIPLSIGGGIGQSRTYMYFLRKAHLGECSVTIWPEELKRICAEKNIHVLQ